MNRKITLMTEKFLDLAYTLVWTPNTPNPFEPIFPYGFWWLDLSPEKFYAVSSAAPQLRFGRAKRGLFATRVRFSYPSAYRSNFAVNNTVHGLVNLRPQGKARGAVIFVHGHAMNTFFPMEWLARQTIEQGFDVYYIALPYHMQRAPKGTWGGQYSLSSSIEGTAIAFMQGVCDVRLLINWIEQVVELPVALAGISLGAFTSCMAAVVDERPRAVVSIIGGGNVGKILWDGYRLGQMRHQLEKGGVNEAALDDYWALLNPENWQPQVDPSRVLVIGGEHDPIVTPENVLRLQMAWNTPAPHWYPAGHTTIGTFYKEMGREMAEFLAKAV